MTQQLMINQNNNTIRIPFTGKLRSSISKLGIVILSLPKDLRPHGKVRFLDKLGMTNHECHLEPAERSHMYNRKRFLDRLGMTSTKRNSKYQILNTKRRRLFPYIVLAILAVGIFTFLRTPQIAEAGWFDDTYGYRTPILFENSSAAIDAERRVLLEIDTATLISAGKMQADCDDSRFVYNGTLVDFYIGADACNDASTDYYVTLPSIAAGANTVWMYYSNDAASSIAGSIPGLSTADLVAYWSMEETSGTRTDAHSNGYDLTDNNTVTSDTGIQGTAADFEADASEYLSITNAAGPNLEVTTGDHTIVAWVKPETVNLGEYAGRASGANQYLLRSSGGAGGGQAIWYGDTAGQQVATLPGATYVSGTWTMVSSWHDSTSEVIGTQANDGTPVTTSLTGGIEPATSDFNIGRGRLGNTWDGLIDEVAVFSAVLSSSDLEWLYNSGAGRTYSELAAVEAPIPLFTPTSTPATGAEEQSPQPVAYWKFDEGFGSTTQDHTSNDNDGSITGATWQTEDKCVSGKCLYFDGTDDEIDMGSDDTLEPDYVTLSAWVRASAGDAMIIARDLPTSVYSYDLYIDPSGYPRMEVDGTSLSVSSTLGTTTVHDNQWHHIAGTYDGSTIKIYVDGNLENSKAYAGGILEYNSSASTTIGDRHGSNDFTGFIDEVKIYPYARTAAQVKADFVSRGDPSGASAVLGAANNTNLTEDLVAYWDLDETSANSCSGGEDTCDSSGVGNHGIWGADATNGTGKFGNGVSFDGSDDYVLSNSTADLGTTYSVSQWVKSDSTGTGTQALFHRGQSDFCRYEPYLYIDADNDELSANVSGCSNSGNFASGISISEEEWHHVAITVNGNAQVLYLDGTEVATGSKTSENHDKTFAVGGIISNTSPTSTFFKGEIDETRVYDRVLSPTEVRQLYNWAPGPIIHYQFDENSGSSVSDSSGNEKSALLAGGVDASTAWVTGKYGSAFKLDGSDDYLYNTNPGLPTNADPWTVSLWAKPEDTGDTAGNVWLYNAINWGTHDATSKSAQLQINEDRINWTTYGSLGAVYYEPPSPFIDTWHHISVSFDGTNVRLYVDGILRHTGADASALAITDKHLCIGSYPNVNGCLASRHYQGALDDIRFYNYARSQKQVVQDMNGGHPAGGSPVASQHNYWNLDEQQGQTSNDSGYADNDGTFGASAGESTDDPTWKTTSDCILNGCADFDGGDYIDLGTEDQDGELTVTAWINTDTLTASETSNTIIANFFSTGTAGDYGFEINRTSGKVSVLWGNSSFFTLTGDTSLTTDTWYHVAFVRSGSTGDWTGKLFLNGVLDGSGTTAIDPGSSGKQTAIGRQGGYTGNYFDGTLDEVKVYTSALTQEEILVDYNFGAATLFGQGTGATDAGLEPSEAGNPPVAEWKLDENTGTTANDTSGNGNTGTITGATWALGANDTGQGLEFDGTSSKVTVSTSTSLTSATGESQARTMSTWVHFTSSDTEVISENGTAEDFYLLASGGKLYWSCTTGGGNDVESNDTLNDGAWHHFTGTFDGSTLRMYIDGALQDETNSIGGTCPADDSDDLLLGQRSGDSFPYSGKLDSVKIYDYALSQSQIAFEYNGGEPHAHWKLDDCTGTTAYDTSGNGLNGTIAIGSSGTNTSAGTCGSGTGTEAWNNGTSGKFNYSLDFDGTDDYIELTSLEIPTTAGSASLWWNPQESIAGVDHPLFTTRTGTAYFDLYSYFGTLYAGWHADPGNDDRLTWTGNISTDTWYHITLTWEDGGEQVLYVNGLEKTSAGSLDATWDTSSATTHIAGSSTGGLPKAAAQIDDVRIYNYPLSADQVKRLYNNDSSVYYGP